MFTKNIKLIAMIIFVVPIELLSRIIIERTTNIGYDIIIASKGEIWGLQKLLTALMIIVAVIIFDTVWKCLANYIETRGREKLRLQVMQQEIEMSKVKLEEYKASNERLHKVKHEIARIVTMTKLMLEKGEYDRANEYLNEFGIINNSIKADYSFSENLVLDYVIGKYKSYCETNGIIFKCMIGNVSLIMDDVDLHILFENLLENACEAASKAHTSDKLVDVQIDLNSIRITNSARLSDYEAMVKQRTTKADKKNHGYGVLNINDIVKKYSGSIEYEFLDIYVECRIVI